MTTGETNLRNGATEIFVSGMTCNNCARHVTEAIQSVSGVRSATVSLQNKNALVRWNAGAAENIPAILQAVKSAGYDAKEIQNDPCGCGSCHAPAHQSWQINLWLGVVVTAFLMCGEWIFRFGATKWFPWVSFFLAAVVQIFSGAQFYRGAWRQLKIGSSNMDTLVALGSTTAFGYSAWALLSGYGGHLYFMEAAAIITLISGGHYLEARVSEKAGGALKSLMQLAPQTARKISRSNGRESAPAKFDIRHSSFQTSQSRLTPAATEEIEIAVSQLQIGDRIVLRPGDRVPVDGIMVEGESALDESSLTGESNPVDKKSGAELFAGTVNLNGRLVMRVTATGEETALAHVIAAVQRAQTSRADIQRLGDRVSSVFVPIIVAIAVGAGLWWGLAPESANRVHEFLAQFLWHAHAPAGIAVGFIIAAAVLIIACPCAMGLATPAAIMAGANAASRRGILIRDGVALEKAGKISAIIFDKTGTLTEGKPKIVSAKFFPIELSEELKQFTVAELAASIAALSHHPLSKAIADSNTARHPIKEFKEISGRGITGLFPATEKNSHLMQLGSLRWLSDEGVDCSEAGHFANEWMNQAATVIGLSIDVRLVALFALRDTLKEKAVEVIDRLENPFWNKKYKIFIVSGDSRRTVNAIARELKIDEWDYEKTFSEIRPEQKAEFVKKLQGQGERVAFVGDGINDAPALTQADLGIAVSRASDIAREAADIILLKSEIEAVPEALGLARATLRTIKQNLFWAFFYNAIGVPLAALGFISPIACAAAMGVSDLIVIGNALRLLRWRN
ncbi:MAG TPA: cation-translocating P-type ATPase [Verrucomicrobiae bacterium]|nr:cation-translocating P-type ATPase [Verrucomicrobiae bacterium]